MKGESESMLRYSRALYLHAKSRVWVVETELYHSDGVWPLECGEHDKSTCLPTVQVDLGGSEKLNGYRREKFAANRSRQEIVPSSRRSLELNSASMPLPGAECSFASRGLHIFTHTKTEGSTHCFLDICLQSCATLCDRFFSRRPHLEQVEGLVSTYK
jgi:hypothetical protein